MKNSIGTSVIFTLFGESHGPYIGGVLDGLSAGIKVDENFIKENLARRRPSSSIDTARKEDDKYQIVSGVFNGFTTGSPIAIIIPNEDVNSASYSKEMIRPSHADYVSYEKYHGFNDYRGGGHFSGRLTAPIVALGSIALKALENKGIKIVTHIKKCGHVVDQDFSHFAEDYLEIKNKNIPVIDDIEKDIEKEILSVKEEGDSIGGILQTAIIGLPAGVGEPWFSSLEGVISQAMFAIGGVKGIEFGKGFAFSEGRGSELNDAFAYEDDKVVTKTNHNGGINGGISNGMPIIFNLAVKPTPSISKEQDSIDLEKKENVKIKINGRHDPAIIRRMAIVIDTLVAIIIADELEKRFGVDYLAK